MPSELLEKENIGFQEILVDENQEARAEMERKSGRQSVPQIFINGKHVGGYDDLKVLYDKGELDSWLKPN